MEHKRIEKKTKHQTKMKTQWCVGAPGSGPERAGAGGAPESCVVDLAAQRCDIAWAFRGPATERTCAFDVRWLGGKRAAYGATSGSQVLGGGALQWHIDGVGLFVERGGWVDEVIQALMLSNVVSSIPCRA